MKKNFLLFGMMLIASIGFSQTGLPLDFESGPYTFHDFDGGVTTVIENPHSDGINTSANVAQQVRDGGQTWGGGWILLDSYLDFSTNNTFTMKVYSPAADVPVLFKIEGDGGVSTSLTVNTTVANEWELMTFDFTGEASETYNKLVLIFNMGTVGAGETYLFDDIEFIAGSSSVNEISRNNLTVYPNPVTDVFVLDNDLHIKTLNIYNLLGQRVSIERISENRFNISKLAAGVYVINAVDQNNNVVTGKIIKK